jgi:squalene-hopene/tetraprenyl-beta-curcumene cyclase
MQSSDGGWGAFDVDNTSRIVAALPFCDFGAVTDPPSADVTAHVLETMAHEGREHELPAQRGIEWLLRAQERDGSWFGRWGANHVYGTGAVLPALAACGLRDHPSVARGVEWLASVQNPSGGFGEDLRSYRDTSWRGRGASTASQTAWALIGLHAAGETGPVAERAIGYLVETQLPGGGWNEPYYTGTGFPGDFYLNYHLYRDVFPVMALGRALG